MLIRVVSLVLVFLMASRAWDVSDDGNKMEVMVGGLTPVEPADADDKIQDMVDQVFIVLYALFLVCIRILLRINPP